MTDTIVSLVHIEKSILSLELGIFRFIRWFTGWKWCIVWEVYEIILQIWIKLLKAWKPRDLRNLVLNCWKLFIFSLTSCHESCTWGIFIFYFLLNTGQRSILFFTLDSPQVQIYLSFLLHSHRNHINSSCRILPFSLPFNSFPIAYVHATLLKNNSYLLWFLGFLNEFHSSLCHFSDHLKSQRGFLCFYTEIWAGNISN